MYVNTVGKILETVSVKEPKAGNDVYLTLDKDLQITAYKLLEEKVLDKFVQNKTISKIKDSYRVSKNIKEDSQWAKITRMKTSELSFDDFKKVGNFDKGRFNFFTEEHKRYHTNKVWNTCHNGNH